MEWSSMLKEILTPFDEPHSRLYITNLISTFILVQVWFWLRCCRHQRQEKNRVISTKKWIKMMSLIFFNKKYWFCRSSLIDFGLFIFNGFLKALLLGFFLQLSFFIARLLIHLGDDVQTFFDFELHVSTSQTNIFLFTLFAFIMDDFLRFFQHYLSHRIPLLWQLHRVHHTATVLTPFTLYRTHPVESLLNSTRNALSLGVSTGLFVLIFDSPLTLWTLAGVNAFGYLFNFLGANLRHSQIPLSFGRWEHFFISPRQHQIHHGMSPECYQKNFGVTLAIWDYLLGSLTLSSAVSKKLQFGLNEMNGQSH
ncbi:MAG: sterol desaturase family protein [Bdellovibrionaceae bacterium]|nr:sterol desaturase family protein [Pseudobdellovibrionaceae bacterium]MDW8191031.1 sterol desaturase family protein [Pseudobdellovibrionaceae bacterium]